MARYRTQHIAVTPAGWRVRSKRAGGHILRIAFPPGRRKRGDGRVVEVLHPKRENPGCDVERQNPEQLLIFGLNPSPYEYEAHTEAGEVSRSFKKKEEAEAWLKSKGGKGRIVKTVRVDAPYLGHGPRYSYRRETNAGSANPRNAQRGWAVLERGRDLRHSSFVSWPTRAQADKALREVRESYPQRQWKIVRVKGDTNPSAGGFGNHKPGCPCAFCQRAAKLQSGELQPPALPNRPRTNAGGVGSMRVVHDPAARQFRAEVQYRGSWVDAYGYTKKEAAKNLRDTLRAMRAGNPARQRPQPRKGESMLAFHQQRVREMLAKMPPQIRAVFDRNPGNPGAAIEELRQALRDETDEAKKHKLRSLLAKFGAKRFVARGVPLASRSTRAVFDRLRGRNPEVSAQEAGHLFRIARIAGHESRHARLRYAAREYVKAHPGASSTAVYKQIDRYTRPYSATNGRRRNPDETQQAVQLFQTFHGKDPRAVVEKQEPAIMREDYAAIGPLEHLVIKSPLGQIYKVEFEGDGVILASSPDGRQLYCIGGNQNLAGVLDADSLQKDLIDLGECIEVQYLARKVHTHFEPVSWHHSFGEKSGERPELIYDKLKRRIFFAGGAYYIDTSAEISPGIEN